MQRLFSYLLSPRFPMDAGNAFLFYSIVIISVADNASSIS